MKEIARKVKLLEPLDVNKIAIAKDHYFHDALVDGALCRNGNTVNELEIPVRPAEKGV